jgi:hypothetical protein
MIEWEEIERKPGPLIEPHGIIGRTQIPKYKEAGEEATEGYHLPEWEAHGDEEMKWRARSNIEDYRCAGEMLHRERYLHVLELGVAEDPGGSTSVSDSNICIDEKAEEPLR